MIQQGHHPSSKTQSFSGPQEKKKLSAKKYFIFILFAFMSKASYGEVKMIIHVV